MKVNEAITGLIKGTFLPFKKSERIFLRLQKIFIMGGSSGELSEELVT